MTDEEAVRAALAGDQDAYTLLFKRLQPLVRKTAWKFSRDTPEAEEFAADCVAHILMRLGKFDGTAKFSTWATRVAINVALGQKRARKYKSERTVSLEDRVGHSDSDQTIGDTIQDPRSGMARVEAVDDLEKLLAGIGRTRRAAVVANKIHGYTAEEIATARGRTASSVKSLIHHGIRKARENMQELHSGNLNDLTLDTHEGMEGSPVADRIRTMTFEPKLCICGCGETFTPSGPRQIFVMGHRMPAAQVRKPREVKLAPNVSSPAAPAPAPTSLEPAPAVVADEMVNLRVPASALDALLKLLPTQMKADAVARILTSL